MWPWHFAQCMRGRLWKMIVQGRSPQRFKSPRSYCRPATHSPRCIQGWLRTALDPQHFAKSSALPLWLAQRGARCHLDRLDRRARLVRRDPRLQGRSVPLICTRIPRARSTHPDYRRLCPPEPAAIFLPEHQRPLHRHGPSLVV